MSVFILDNGVWNREIPVISENGDEGFQYESVLITDVPVTCLLQEWESLVSELSSKEVKLLIKKEYIKEQTFKIEQETDFKEIYGKNNADIRKQHIKVELSDVFDKVQSLELSINWIRSYIPLLKEVVRCKQ